MKLRELWNNGSESMAALNKDNGRADARLLLMHILNLNYTQFIMNLEQQVDASVIKQFELLQDLYLKNKPLQYIIGKQEFMGLEFLVNENVLIPRGDTEILVQEVLNKANKQQDLSIVDIGTGSGAIVVTLATLLPHVRFKAIDISAAALEVASLNAKSHGVLDRIEFIKGNLLNPLIKHTDKYHVIVSNPPYITIDEMKTLPLNVKQEPHLALVGGTDGLDFYRRLAQDAPNLLKDEGYLIVEIGFSQSEQVQRIFAKNGFSNIEIIKDFAKLPRVVVGKLKKTL